MIELSARLDVKDTRKNLDIRSESVLPALFIADEASQGAKRASNANEYTENLARGVQKCLIKKLSSERKRE